MFDIEFCMSSNGEKIVLGNDAHHMEYKTQMINFYLPFSRTIKDWIGIVSLFALALLVARVTGQRRSLLSLRCLKKPQKV